MSTLFSCPIVVTSFETLTREGYHRFSVKWSSHNSYKTTGCAVESQKSGLVEMGLPEIRSREVASFPCHVINCGS